MPHSSETLRKIWSNYINEVTSVEIGESKSLLCASAVNELMGQYDFISRLCLLKSPDKFINLIKARHNLGMAVSWLFVDPSFHEGKGKKVFEMLSDIKEAFATLVLRSDWMDKKTKTATLEKNRKMESQIGFPDWLFNEAMLNEYYEGV